MIETIIIRSVVKEAQQEAKWFVSQYMHISPIIEPLHPFSLHKFVISTWHAQLARHPIYKHITGKCCTCNISVDSFNIAPPQMKTL